MNNENRSIMSIIMKMALIIMVLLLMLALITSLITGKSFLNEQIWSGIIDIYSLALFVLFLLIIAIFIGVLITIRLKPKVSKNIINKENTLRYKRLDTDKITTIDISNINNYLDKYKKIYIIDDYVISKKDDKQACVTNLMINYDNKMISLNDLYNKNPNEYHKICTFLDEISSLNEIDLIFHLNSIVSKNDILLDKNNVINSFIDITNKIDDIELNRHIKCLINDLNDSKIVNNIKYQRIFNYYLPMLIEICEDFIIKLNNDNNTDRSSDTRNNIINTIELIRKVLKTFDNSDNYEDIIANVEELKQLK